MALTVSRDRHRRYLLVLLLVAGTASGAAAQQGVDDLDIAQESSRTGPGVLVAGVSISGVFDSNIDHDDRDVDSFGATTGARLQLRTGTAGVEYRLGFDRFTGSERWDRTTHRVIGRVGGRLTPNWTGNVIGQIALAASADDREIGNLYIVTPRLDYRLGRGRRLRGYGTYRWKDVQENPTQSAGTTYAGAEFSQDAGDRQEWMLEYRYETNESPSSRQRYARHTYGSEYLLEASTRDELRVGGTLGLQHYPERLVKVESGSVARRDRRWTFDVAWIRTQARGVAGEIAYEFSARTSNEIDKRFHAHRIAYTVFWQGSR